MDAVTDPDWKRNIGFPINYSSGQSSEDDFDKSDVVMRHPRKSSSYLLADGGDGAPADLLGTTPPRARIRGKEKRRDGRAREGFRNSMDSDTPIGRMLRAGRWQTMCNMYSGENQMPSPPDRKKRQSVKTLARGRERDLKMDLTKEHRADSLPSPNVPPPVPTLVESFNRFMSLTSSRLKCKEKLAAQAVREVQEEQIQQQQEREEADDETVPQKRVSFHKTFSMLIKMGNIDKTCRRAISLEEQVWQNELKDLIWLELQAKIAGRTPPQQDAFLCAQREIVPTIIQNIINYRFVNPSPCARRHDTEHSEDELDGQDPYSYLLLGCLSLNCLSCTDAIGKALREVGTLLDSFYNAETLYPSSKAMANHHPLIATQLFNNRLKAMCLWYNIALHMRMKLMAVQRLVVSIKAKAGARQRYSRRLTSSESETSRGNEAPRTCTVRFNIDGVDQPENQNPSDSNNSDSSSNSEHLNQQKTVLEVESRSPPENENENIAENDNQNIQEEDVRNELSTPSTPEIHISDMENRNNGTVDTTTSTESGYLSDKSSLPLKDFFSKCEENLYNVYTMGPLEEVVSLKLLGKCSVSPYRQYHYEILKTQGVRKCMMFVHKMNKKILNKVYLTLEKENSTQAQQYKDNEPEEVFEDTKDETERQDSKEMIELRRYGCWSEETLQMRLPSYRNHFLLLSTNCLETVHDYLSLRLDTQPAKPSCLTVKQLIHELKEGLDIATEMRSAFVRNIDAALADYPADAPIEADLLAVIRTFDDTVENVLKQYLSYLTTMSEVEHMPRSTLEAEWGFTARLAKRMRCAAELGPLSFSDIVCNQMDRLIKQFSEKFARLTTYEDNIPDDDSDEAKRHFVYALCRQAQDIYASERELTIQTVQFSRLLATRLKKNNRFVRCRERIFKSLMRIRDCIVLHADKIAEKTAIAPWEDINPETAEGLFSRIRELLMQVYKLSFEFHKEMHRFINDGPPEKGRAAGPAAGRRQSSGSPPSRPLRPRFVRSESIGGQDYDIGVFDDYYSTASVDGGVPEMRFEEDEPRKSSFATAISEANRRAETGPEAGPEPEGVELRRVREGEWEVLVSRAIIQFAKSWMKFVVERCDRGRGLRPRWASQGLEFLMLACDPCNTRHLTDDEFEELKNLMDGCISHVIGSTPKGPRQPEPAATTPPAPGRRHRHRLHNPLVQAQSMSKEVPTPPTPPSEPEPVVNFHVQEVTIHSRRVQEATQGLDSMRDEKLRKMKAVGRLVESTAVTSYEPKLRQVTFKWQRGLKIGAGTFGKVYTVVNTETGQLLAMKEISIGVGDRRALQKAANELKVLEGIIHPHLVRYYGCEIHKEEMLIFMELCVEGSLEALLASGGALPEPQVRRYTKQLLSAVHQLHARNIAHRDIKSGNIFLTNEGHCLKLGDFGCAVKIRANTTAAGELQGCVGTQAYMAPEVFMKSTGHGRAADIWSLGCVVTEMASGKRPFAEYDSNYQIMFVVGMGGRPQIPAALSDEGQEFCLACLTHDPEERPRAEVLKMHHFLMIKSDNDCNCEPSYMITKKELM